MERFESKARQVLDRLRKEKADNAPHFNKVKLDLKTCTSLREKERVKSSVTRRNIERRRDHLKQAVDEIADDLLHRHQTRTNEISKVFDEFERQVEEKVKNILRFQNDLAHLENSSDYKLIIETGSRLSAPSLPCFEVPSIDRISLKQVDIDRLYIKQMFGEEMREDIRQSFLSESLEHRESQESDKTVNETNPKDHSKCDQGVPNVEFDSTIVSVDPKPRLEVSTNLETLASQSRNHLSESSEPKIKVVTANKDRKNMLRNDEEVIDMETPQSLKVTDPSNIRKRYGSSKRRAKGYSIGEAKIISDGWRHDETQDKVHDGFYQDEKSSMQKTNPRLETPSLEKTVLRLEQPSSEKLSSCFKKSPKRPGSLSETFLQENTASGLLSIEDDILFQPRHSSSLFLNTNPIELRGDTSKSMSRGSNGVLASQSSSPVRRTSSKVNSQDEAGVILSTFQHTTLTPTAISPADNGHCWIIYNNANEIKLISNSGVVKKTVSVSGSMHLLGMTGLADGSLLICSPQTKCIKQVHYPSCHVFENFHTAPLIPVGMCVSATGDILMTLIDKWSYDKSRDSHRVLMKCNSNWKMTAEAKYSKHGGNLFVLPYKVAVSSTGKLVAVINQTSDMTSHLMLFDINFTLLLRCVGHENVVLGDKFDVTMTERFNVMDVKFDVTDNLVIIEGYTGTVQVLDPVTCRPLRILVKEQGNPWTLAVHDQYMWVGFQDGRIKFLSY